MKLRNSGWGLLCGAALLAGCSGGGNADGVYSAGDYVQPETYGSGPPYSPVDPYGPAADPVQLDPDDSGGAPGASYAAPGAVGAGQSYPPPPSPQTGYPAQAQPPGDYPVEGGTAPRGTSRSAPEQGRYDAVGYAGMLVGGDPAQLAAASDGLRPGSFVEVTSLTSGRTILLEINVPSPVTLGPIIDFSPAAAAQLGLTGGNADAVRVREITPTVQDQAEIRSGLAPKRIDAPPALLVGLRKQLARQPTAPVGRPFTPSSPPVRQPAARPAPAPAQKGGYFVQVAALSSKGRADDLARQLGGFVSPSGSLFRVQIGPFADRARADRARADAAGHGFSDARVFESR